MNVRRIAIAVALATAVGTGLTSGPAVTTTNPGVAAPAYDPNDPNRTPGGPYRDRDGPTEGWGQRLCEAICTQHMDLIPDIVDRCRAACSERLGPHGGRN